MSIVSTLKFSAYKSSKQCLKSFGDWPIYFGGKTIPKHAPLPQTFGQFKKLPSQYYEHLKCILESELPQSRRTLETLKLSIRQDTFASFYIPKMEEPSKMSGMVLVIPKHHQSVAFSYFSKQKDIENIHALIDQSVDWTSQLVFGGVPDWHIPSLMTLCQNRSEKAQLEEFPLWEKTVNEYQEGIWKTKPLTCEKYAKLMHDNWEFRDDTSLQWIKKQCENGMAFGVFSKSKGGFNEEPVSWAVAYT